MASKPILHSSQHSKPIIPLPTTNAIIKPPPKIKLHQQPINPTNLNRYIRLPIPILSLIHLITILTPPSVPPNIPPQNRNHTPNTLPHDPTNHP
ncbi:hypothetical protein M7I_5492 [Glarea lozoyensis 74030]|uniref:Uncharacterized protein n=1 Tax=Glarea lozoyensis (strain ATCC 74030 / MF5533) TaxID=1104152 RepID=H0ES18_GLAL7|nr:hypothetical protein M7I_5492 [Glarea lozoyensis 74030]